MRNNILFFAVPALIAMFFSCTSPSYKTCNGAVWGTVYNITYNSLENLDDSIRFTMECVNQSLSPFNDSSVISRINRGENIVADTMFRRAFTLSQDINRRSHGKFDPTVAPLVNLWGFGYRNYDKLPTHDMIDSTLASVGIDRCRLLPDGTISKPCRDTEFNFSAIAKGLGCDMIAEMLSRNGCNDFMIEIGGEITVKGVNRHRKPWRIMIDAPVDNGASISHNRLATITQGDGGIATSGNYRNFRHSESGKIWHTIDPHTGYPAKTAILSATVIAPCAAEADALATACLAMSPDSAITMIQEYPRAEAMIVTGYNNGKWNILKTDAFPTLE